MTVLLHENLDNMVHRQGIPNITASSQCGRCVGIVNLTDLHHPDTVVSLLTTRRQGRHEMHAQASQAAQTPIFCSQSANIFPSPAAALSISIPQLRIPSPLPRSAPDALEEAVLLCEPVDAVVALAHGAYEAAERVCLVLARVAAVLIDLADADLDGRVVLGFDDASGGRLAGISIAIRGLVVRLAGTHAFSGDVDCETISDYASKWTVYLQWSA
jgi:hypothetical protein